MTLTKKIILALVAVILSGCATAGGKTDTGRPGHGSGGPPFYPESEYLTAEGIGQSEPEARQRALSELSRIFEARVVSDTTDAMLSVYKRKGRKESEDFAQKVESKIRVTSDVAFEGVRTEDTWVSEQDRMVHALAVLNRAEAGEAWSAKILDLDNRVGAELRAAGEIGSSLARFRAYRRVENFWLERALYESRLRVIGVPSPRPDYNMGAVLEEAAVIRSNLTLFIDVEGDQGDLFRGGLESSLTSAGFRFVPDRDRANVILGGHMTVSMLDLDNPGWFFARAEAEVSLTDTATGERVGSISNKSRASHVDFREASRKAVRKLTGVIAEELLLLFE